MGPSHLVKTQSQSGNKGRKVRERFCVVENGMPVCPRCKSNDQVTKLSPPRDEADRSFGIVYRCTYEWWHWTENIVNMPAAAPVPATPAVEPKRKPFSWKRGMSLRTA